MKRIQDIKKMKDCINILENQISISKIQIRNIESYINRLEKQLQKYEEIKLTQISSNIDLKLLHKEEIHIIIENMDKTDYRIYSKFRHYPRYIDYIQICKEVITIKQIYPKWKLIHLEKGVNGLCNCQHTNITNIFYKYQYQDEYNNIFDKIVYI